MKSLSAKIIFLVTVSLFLSIPIFAQDNLQKGIELYKSGNFKESVKTLKKVKKNDKDAYLGFHYLGLSYQKQSNLKKALEAFETSVKLNPKFAKSKTALAYAYLQTGNLSKAINTALESILLDSKDYVNFYTLGLAYHKLKNNSEAIEFLNISIEKKPGYDAAIILRRKILKGSPELAKNKTDKEEYRRRQERYQEPNETLEEYITRIAKLKELKYWEEQADSIDFFVTYFKEVRSSKNDETRKTTRGIKIVSKPSPGYTINARTYNIGGIIRVLVGFEADAKIRHAIILEGLGYGLDERVIKAVKKVKFEPEMKENKPITTVRIVQYSFTIY